MSFQKVHLLVEPDGGGSWTRVEAWFNPTSLNVKRTAKWGVDGVNGKQRTYLGGQEQALSLKLLFHAEGNRTSEHVQLALDDMYGLLKPSDVKVVPARVRPPKVIFVWGSYRSKPAVCTCVDVTTELFDLEGKPLRAWVSLTLSENPDESSKDKPTNPTTMATQRRRAHEVAPGEDLALIAQHHYRDPTRWREIATANHLDDPLKVHAAALLVIPLEEL